MKLEKISICVSFAGVALLFSLCGCQTTDTLTSSSVTEGPIGSEPITRELGPRNIIAMTEKIAAELRALNRLGNGLEPPRIVLDESYFENQSSSVINLKLMTTRLRALLNGAANDQFVFVTGDHMDLLNKEREEKRESGLYDVGTLPPRKALAAPDYQLVGIVLSEESVSHHEGKDFRYYLVSFEMLELESGIQRWSGIYEVSKVGQLSAAHY